MDCLGSVKESDFHLYAIHFQRRIDCNSFALPLVMPRNSPPFLYRLVEQARVRCEGWAYRATHEAFLARYGMLSLHTWPCWRGQPLEGCALLLADLPLTPAQYTFGRNKVFIKSQRAVSIP